MIFRWDGLARVYNWAMTIDALKATMYRHSKVLGEHYDMRRVSSTTCIQVTIVTVLSVIQRNLGQFSNVGNHGSTFSFIFRPLDFKTEAFADIVI